MAENIFRIEAGTPRIAASAHLAPGAVVIGDVDMGEESSLWPNAVIRADEATIAIGAQSNIQDGSALHSDPAYPLTVGARVSVGHNVVLHGCVIADDVLVGMSSTIMNGAHVGSGSIIGAGTLITQGTNIPENSLVVGAPARVVRETTEAEREAIALNWRVYVDRLAMHRAAVRVDREGNDV